MLWHPLGYYLAAINQQGSNAADTTFRHFNTLATTLKQGSNAADATPQPPTTQLPNPSTTQPLNPLTIQHPNTPTSQQFNPSTPQLFNFFSTFYKLNLCTRACMFFFLCKFAF